MKKQVHMALVLAASLAGLVSCAKKADGDLLSQIQARGKLVIATEGEWSPWTYHDEHDKLVGFDVEVAEHLAQKLGVTAVFAETSWDGIFAGIDSKRYDIAANGVEITEERSQKYDFSIPYGYIHTALITRDDNSTISDFADLKGKRTTNSLGSTYASLAESYGATVITIDTLDETLQLVQHGRADATLNADVSFYDYMNVHPDAPFKVVASTQEASHVALPIRKGAETATFRVAVDKALGELLADGTISALSVKYFGKDVSKN